MPTPPATRRRPARQRTAQALVVASLAVALVIAAGWMPGPVGTAVSVILPLLGILAVVLTGLVLAVRRRAALAAAVAPLVWMLAAVPLFPALPAAARGPEFTIASQNVRAQSGGGAASVVALAAEEPGVITLTELDDESRAAAGEALADRYPYSYGVGTVGIWSVHPLSSPQPLDLDLGWSRALRVTVQAPAGDIAVYLVHAASLRPGVQSARDQMLTHLAGLVRDDPASRVVALGDFNAATTDPALAPLAAELDRVRPTDGLGFTWPAVFPLVRIDHVFQRGFAVGSAETRRAGASDHLATMTRLSPR